MARSLTPAAPLGVLALVLALGAVMPLPAARADGFPARPITVVVPFPPGGVADVSIRAIQPALEKQLGQPLVISNRAGAAGAVGMGVAAGAAADGYTILCALVSISTIPEVDRLFGRTPVFHREDFAPIARLNADPPMLVVDAKLPYATLKDLVADAEAKPAQIIYASSGIYGASHVPMEMLLHAAHITMRHLPTTGGAPAIAAVLGGNAAAWASPPALAAPLIAAGKLKPLAVWGDKRLGEFPDVPSMKESGYDLEYYLWAGLFAPKAVPQDVLAALRRAVAAANRDPGYIEAMNKLQTPIAYLDGPDFQVFWDKDAQMLAEVIHDIGRIDEKP
jgi:tripartite-type tricarboxylate transporter receptor subunit TctC